MINQENVEKIKAIYRFIKPNRYKIAVLIVISMGMTFNVEEKYIETTDTSGKRHLTHIESFGKPTIVQITDDIRGEVYYDQIAILVAIAYGITLVLFSLFLLLCKVLVRGSFGQRAKAFVYLVFIGGLPYLALMVIGNDLLVSAVHGRHSTYARLLVKLGISPNRLSLNDLDFPLKAAAYNQDHVMADWLLRKGADPLMANSQGRTALHIAVARNAICVARLLLSEKPCSVNGKIKTEIDVKINVNPKDAWGNTPLHLARHRVLVKLLVKHGADVNAVNKRGQTPLFTQHRKKAKDILLTHGAKVNMLDKKGNSVLHFAKNPQEVFSLVKAGVKVNQRNLEGKTALHLIVEASKLKKHGNIRVYEVVSGDELNRPGVILELAKALLKSGVEVDARDNSGLSALHYAIKYCDPSRKFRSTLEIGKLLFTASKEAQSQTKNRKLKGQLAEAVSNDKLGCWVQFAGNKAIKPNL